MLLYFAAQTARVLAGDPSDGTDHTQQISIVAEYLASYNVEKLVSSDVDVRNRDMPSKSTLEDFRAYASECPIERISAVAVSSTPLPIGVKWDCRRLIEIDGETKFEERYASLWITDQSISRIDFGEPGTIPIEEVRAKVLELLRERARTEN